MASDDARSGGKAWALMREQRRAETEIDDGVHRGGTGSGDAR